MSRPDEGLIHAWLDGELDAAEAQRVARLVETDAEWGAAAAEARGLIAAGSRIVGSLDVVPGGVIPAGSRAGGVPKPRFTVRPWMRVAAALVLVAGVGYVATTPRMDPPLAGSEVAGGLARDAAREGGGYAAKVEAAADTPTVARTPSPVSQSSASRSPAPPSSAPAGRASAAVPAEVDARELERRNESQDAIAVGRRLEDARLSEVVPTGVASTSPPAPFAPPQPTPTTPPSAARAPTTASAAGATSATSAVLGSAREQTAQLRPRQVIDRAAPSAEAFTARDAAAVTGCWRTRTAAPMDSILLEPRLVPERGDTLRLEVAGSAVSARVLYVGPDTLTGTATDASGRRHPFRAVRVSCP